MIPYLDVQHLSKSFGALQLFSDISFSIGEGQKVGLIAKNGTGKSTLLSILSGKEGYDSGSIVFRRDLKVGMLEQSPVFDPDETVLDACFNHQGDPEKVLKAPVVEKVAEVAPAIGASPVADQILGEVTPVVEECAAEIGRQSYTAPFDVSRHKLVSPDILGVSSGCCVGAGIAILL